MHSVYVFVLAPCSSSGIGSSIFVSLHYNRKLWSLLGSRPAEVGSCSLVMCRSQADMFMWLLMDTLEARMGCRIMCCYITNRSFSRFLTVSWWSLTFVTVLWRSCDGFWLFLMVLVGLSRLLAVFDVFWLSCLCWSYDGFLVVSDGLRRSCHRPVLVSGWALTVSGSRLEVFDSFFCLLCMLYKLHMPSMYIHLYIHTSYTTQIALTEHGVHIGWTCGLDNIVLSRCVILHLTRVIHIANTAHPPLHVREYISIQMFCWSACITRRHGATHVPLRNASSTFRTQSISHCTCADVFPFKLLSSLRESHKVLLSNVYLARHEWFIYVHIIYSYMWTVPVFSAGRPERATAVYCVT